MCLGENVVLNFIFFKNLLHFLSKSASNDMKARQNVLLGENENNNNSNYNNNDGSLNG